MKTLNFYPYVIFILLTFVLGCNEYIDGYKATWEYQYETAVAKSLKAEKPQNRIFLNFELGMTPDMYNFHYKKLTSTQILNQVQFVELLPESSLSNYKLHLASGDYDVNYQPVFEAGKLVQMNLILRPDISAKNLTKVYQEIIAVYVHKYGKDYIEKQQIYGPNDFFWLNSNRQIKVSRSPFSVEISYSDLNWYDVATETNDTLAADNITTDSTLQRNDL